MKHVIIYGSKTGNSWKVASRLASFLEDSLVINARDLRSRSGDCPALVYQNAKYILVASTWGDGELQEDMEHILVSDSLQSIKKVSLVELGNYYGYDDFSFGAAEIMEKFLLGKGVIIEDILSIDSLPKIDWETLERWIKECVNKI